jgi:hypothetical protein
LSSTAPPVKSQWCSSSSSRIARMSSSTVGTVCILAEVFAARGVNASIEFSSHENALALATRTKDFARNAAYATPGSERSLEEDVKSCSTRCP